MIIILNYSLHSLMCYRCGTAVAYFLMWHRCATANVLSTAVSHLFKHMHSCGTDSTRQCKYGTNVHTQLCHTCSTFICVVGGFTGALWA